MSDETLPRPSDPHAAHRRPLSPGMPRFISARFDVLRYLGGGTFGRVYMAFDPLMERYVALKMPRDPLPADKHWEFLRESRVIAAIHHPHICPVHDVGIDGELPYIVMRYVNGGTLEDLVAREPPTPADALRFVGQVAKGLEAAHARGVIHRDLKPANVLYDEIERKLLLTDFGLARWAESSAASVGGVKGTPVYMAPEQWDPGPRGRFGAISARTDVYSLGVLLFQLLTGVQLFPGTQYQLMLDHCQTEPRRPSEVRPDLDPRLDELCLKALAKQPGDRYGSAKEFADAIAAYLRPRPAPTAPRPTIRTPGEVVEFPLPRGLKMPFCWIPPGTAQLGSPLAEQNAVGSRTDWLAAESEARRGVYTSKGFWLAKYPVTQAEWYAITGATPSYFQAGSAVKGLDTTRFPVEQVSWDMICGKGGFLEKFNAVGGVEKAFGKAGTFALPHEDMWEYACRGGLGNDRPFYFGKELNGTQANIDGNFPFGTATKGPYLERPTSVGTYASKSPHPWGLCDMHGNVWEWCENLYDQTNSRVLRGGSWNYYGRYCRAADRYRSAPDGADLYIGFRLCLPWTS